MMPSRRPSRVTVKLKNGEFFTETVFVSRGDMEDPYSDQELEAKFLSLTGPIYGLKEAKDILERTKKIETFENIRYYTNGI
ncbi:MAG: hypothetical protein QW303_08340, partial [Nitrososphaerota archaeon]